VFARPNDRFLARLGRPADVQAVQTLSQETGLYCLSDIVQADGRTLIEAIRRPASNPRMQNQLNAMKNLLATNSCLDPIHPWLALHLHLPMLPTIASEENDEVGSDQSEPTWEQALVHTMTTTNSLPDRRLQQHQQMLRVFSDGSVRLIDGEVVATFAWFAGADKDGGRVAKEWHGCGKVPRGSGETSSSRAEAMGLLAAMAALDGRWYGCCAHTIDNQAVVTMFETCESKTSTEWLRHVDRDIWREVSARKRRWSGRYQVTWHRSHPERRLGPQKWSSVDWGVFTADELAAEAYNSPEAATIPELTSEEQMEYELYTEGHRVTDSVRLAIREAHMQQRMRRYVGTKSEGDTQWRKVDWATWYSATSSEFGPLRSRVQTAKVMWGWLATMKALARREGHSDSVCPCCGSASEDNWHMLAECNNREVAAARRNWSAEVEGIWAGAPGSVERRAALARLWRLNDDGSIPQWLSNPGMRMVASVDDPDDDGAAMMARAVQAAETLGPKLIWKGLFPTEWRLALAHGLQTTEDEALKLTRRLAKAAASGLRQVWAARNEVLYGNADSKQLERQRIDGAVQEALRCRQHWPDGLVEEIGTWTLSKKKAWLRRASRTRHARNATTQARMTGFLSETPTPTTVMHPRERQHNSVRQRSATDSSVCGGPVQVAPQRTQAASPRASRADGNGKGRTGGERSATARRTGMEAGQRKITAFFTPAATTTPRRAADSSPCSTTPAARTTVGSTLQLPATRTAIATAPPTPAKTPGLHLDRTGVG
jgi:ribonuclease HI